MNVSDSMFGFRSLFDACWTALDRFGFCGALVMSFWGYVYWLRGLAVVYGICARFVLDFCCDLVLLWVYAFIWCLCFGFVL